MLDSDMLPCGDGLATTRVKGVDHRQLWWPKMFIYFYDNDLCRINLFNVSLWLLKYVRWYPCWNCSSSIKCKKGMPTMKKKLNITEFKRFIKCCKCGKRNHNR